MNSVYIICNNQSFLLRCYNVISKINQLDRDISIISLVLFGLIIGKNMILYLMDEFKPKVSSFLYYKFIGDLILKKYHSLLNIYCFPHHLLIYTPWSIYVV